jgi:hypothetical protein
MWSPGPFAEEMDASPRGEEEKTMNPILKGLDYGSNVSTGQDLCQSVAPDFLPLTRFSKMMAKEFPLLVLALALPW